MQWIIRLSAIVIATLVASKAFSVQAHGVVAGCHGGNGRMLIGELNCVVCHVADELSEQLLTKASPDLTQVGGRVTPQYLRKFLAAPHAIKPGTTMPDLLQGVPEGERAEAV